MSIVALKRVANAKYRSHSVAGTGFSLNGITRLRGIGANLGRSANVTPFKGATPMGHGGGARCRIGGEKGRYNKCASSNAAIAVVFAGNGTPQTTVKKSVMNTKGLFETAYKGILHGQNPKSVVKETYISTSSRRTTDLKIKVFEDNKECPSTPRPCDNTPSSDCVAPYTKAVGSISYETYLQEIPAFCQPKIVQPLSNC